MEDSITPALTAKQWSEVAYHGPRGAEHCVGETDDICAYLIAVNNAARTDDNPGKFTRHDVWIIRKLIEDAYIDMQHPGAMRFHQEARTLAAKIAAILPPEV